MTDGDFVRRPSRRGARAGDSSQASRQQSQASRQQPVPGSTNRGSSGSAPPTGGAVQAHRIAQNRRDAQRRAFLLRARMDQALAQLDPIAAVTQNQAEQRVTSVRASVRTAVEQSKQVAEQEHAAILGELQRELAQALTTLSPGMELNTGSSRRATHFAVGELRAGESSVPIVAPLLDHAGWLIRGDRHRAAILARDTAIRALANTPLKHVVLNVFDPMLTGMFGPLAGLRSARGSSFPVPESDANAFVARIGESWHAASRNAELIGGTGRRGLVDLWNSTDMPEGIAHLIVVLDYPYGVDERLHRQLTRIAETRGASGVSLVVVQDASATPERGVLPEELSRALLLITATPTGWELMDLPVPVPFSEPMSAETREELISKAIASATETQGPIVPLTRLLEQDLAEPWSYDSTERIEVLLGEDRHQPLSIQFRTANPPLPNLLVGGAVGQGKSNLLLDIVYSLAVRYSPDDLELLLLDFKQGLEFQRFGPQGDGTGWLPHVSVLSLESNLPFGIAVLKHVSNELDRRSVLFKKASVSSYDDYRRAGHLLPRMLLIVDEFHALFDGADDEVETSVAELSRLAKQGRAYGIHLLLASQTISGIRGLAARGDAIFAQFPLRISLKNTVLESQAILSQGNRAAADLTYRGEIILNENFGGDPENSNTRAIAAFAEPEAMAAVQCDLWARRPERPPMIFIATQYAPWRPELILQSSEAAANHSGLHVLLGQPVAVTQAPTMLTLEPDTDQAVAVVGKDDILAGAALAAMALSAIPQLAGGELIVLEGAPAIGGWLERVTSAAAEADLIVRVVPRDDIGPVLRDDLGTSLDQRLSGPRLILGIGMQRARDMDVPAETPVIEKDDLGFNFTGEGAPTGRSVLARLAREGALNDTYLIASWSSLRAVETDLGLSTAGVSRFVAAGLGLEDLRSIAGVSVRAIDGHPRIGLYDRTESGFHTIVPFGLVDSPGS